MKPSTTAITLLSRFLPSEDTDILFEFSVQLRKVIIWWPHFKCFHETLMSFRHTKLISTSVTAILIAHGHFFCILSSCKLSCFLMHLDTVSIGPLLFPSSMSGKLDMTLAECNLVNYFSRFDCSNYDEAVTNKVCNIPFRYVSY